MPGEHVCYHCRVIFEKPEVARAEEQGPTRCPHCGSMDVQKLDEQGDYRFIRRMSFG